MKKIFTLLLVAFTATFLSQATNNASFNWFLTGGGATGADRSADVVTDASGNIFTANCFLNTATFNSVALTGSVKGSGSSYDNSLFISKISPAKLTSWTISSNVGAVTPVALATTPNGDLIVTGTIRPVVGGATTNANIIDAAGTVTTFSNLLSSTTIVQSFVAKFNSNGIIQWVKEFNSGTAKDKAVTTTALTTDASGDVYVSGTYSNTVILPSATNITLTSTNTTQAAFIAKLNGTDGTAAWALSSTGAIVTETISSLATGDDGYIYAAGIYQNATVTPIDITIGSTTFKPSAGYDLTLIKLNTAGVVSFIQNRSNTLDTRVKDLVVKNGKAYIAGSFKSGTGNVGIKLADGTTNIYSTTTAYLNGFLFAFNSETGADLWQKTVISPAIAEIYGLAVGSDNNLYAFGTHYNALGTTVTSAAVNFGDGITLADTPTSNKLGDLFLSSYNATNGTTKEVHLVGSGSGSETSNALTSYGNNLYLLGSTNSSPLTFENAGTYTTLGAFDFYLASYSVTNPGTGVTQLEAQNTSLVYADKLNHQLVVNNAANIKSAILFDATGRSLKTSTNNSSTLTISTQGIASGVYILQLTTANGNVNAQRLIIQ